MTVLACPVCDGPLTIGAAAATCEKAHAFDLARQGYLNLLLPNKRHSPDPGDNPEMMRSRRAFLHGGFYDQMASATNAVVADVLTGRGEATVADLGCGEGFFLKTLKDHLTAAGPQPRNYVGVDISRTGIRMATTYDRTITWLVASLHHSPFLPQSIDLVLSMCAPISPDDLRRIVASDGAIVTVTPGPDHLDALRALLYSSVVPHPPAPAVLADDARFELSSSSRVRYQVMIDSAAQVMNLLAMTPYYWNISLETKARVEAWVRLDLTVDASINVFRPR